MKIIKGCLTLIGLVVVGFIAITVFVRLGSDNTPPRSGNQTTSQQSKPQAQPTKDDGLTGPQRNAVRSAESYLQMSGFSRDGLIDQLSSEHGSGYDLADATKAVDSLGVDWNKQAARSAKSYLDMSGFSCKGLIEQLSSEHGSKYTVEQATYGAKQAGACN